MPDFWWEMIFSFPWCGIMNWNWKIWFGMWSNTLKIRLLANEKFKAMYDEIYAQIEESSLNVDFSENFFKYHKNNKLVSESSYFQWIKKLKSYFESKKN